jgi:uncharacterized lipoprotein YajG
MKKYAKLIIALGLAGGIMLTGCQKNESGSAEPTATPEPTEDVESGSSFRIIGVFSLPGICMIT